MTWTRELQDPDMTPRIIRDSLHIHRVAYTRCFFVPQYLRYILDMASCYVYVRFTDLADRRTWVGNGNYFGAQTTGESCPNNPAHDGYCVDLNYFTCNEEPDETPNATQYINHEEDTICRIFDGEIMLEDKFHWDANWMLFRIMIELGITQYRTSDLIRQKFIERGYDVKGMIGDPGSKYLHHTHCHLMFKV